MPSTRPSTAVEIVRTMQDIAFAAQGLSLAEYIEWVVESTRRFEGRKLDVRGESIEDRALSLVAEMVRGWARASSVVTAVARANTGWGKLGWRAHGRSANEENQDFALHRGHVVSCNR